MDCIQMVPDVKLCCSIWTLQHVALGPLSCAVAVLQTALLMPVPSSCSMPAWQMSAAGLHGSSCCGSWRRHQACQVCGACLCLLCSGGPSNHPSLWSVHGMTGPVTLRCAWVQVGKLGSRRPHLLSCLRT